MTDAELKGYRDSIADCGCEGEECDLWGCCDVAELLAEVVRLRSLLARCRTVLGRDYMGMDERSEGARVLKDVRAELGRDANA